MFTSWEGSASPLTLGASTVCNVRHSAALDAHLTVELIDVSQGALVRLEDFSLANVTLARGRVVDTSSDDYTFTAVDDGDPFAAAAYDYAEAGEPADVPLAAVPPQQRGPLGEEFRVGGEGGPGPRVVRMDCVPAARNLTGGRSTACVDGLLVVELGHRREAAAWFPPQVGRAVARLLWEDDPWLAAIRQVRGRLRCAVEPHLTELLHLCRSLFKYLARDCSLC